MRSLKLFVLLIFGFVSFASGAENNKRSIVLVTIDGFPARMLEDPKTSAPNIRLLAAEGAVGRRMEVSNPSVTWPNHTTLVTGVNAAEHSVLFNGILERNEKTGTVAINPRKDKTELVQGLTVYDQLHEQGFSTAAINWPCTRGAKTLDDDFPDTPEPLSHSTPRLVDELLAEGILPDKEDKTFRALTGPGRDEIWTKAACHLIKKRTPNFLLIHLLNTDGIHHRYGPESPASYTAIALADKFVGQIHEALKNSGAAFTIFVTADHGFANATRLLQPNVALRQAGLLQIDTSNRVTQAKVQVVPEGGTGLIYFTNPKSREEDTKKVIDLFSKREGVAQLLGPERFAALGYPSPEKNRGMGELVLVPLAGYAVGGGVEGDEFVKPITGTMNLGYHGFISEDNRMDAIFVASGMGIKKGAKIESLENVDIAPTIMHLFGKSLPHTRGRVLKAILMEK
jgi:predicted AlkP superfamily pyrophosphatase or phosphodiesterase